MEHAGTSGHNVRFGEPWVVSLETEFLFDGRHICACKSSKIYRLLIY